MLRSKITHEIARRTIASLGQLSTSAALKDYNREEIKTELRLLAQENIISNYTDIDGINRYAMKTTETPKTPTTKTPVASKKAPVISGINTVEIETITVYRAKDGTIHESKGQAEKHNTINDFIKSYRSAINEKPIAEREQSRILTILSAWEKFRQEKIQHEGA